jgi:hypothetical protein
MSKDILHALVILGAIRGTDGLQTIDDRLSVEAEGGRP